MLSIRTNVASLGAQRSMSANAMSMDRTMERLSSGFRINRASDDAAGLAISEKLKAQVRGLNQASRNALDGISMIQTAESGLDEVQNIMHRMRELAVQSSNDTLGTNERRDVYAELSQLRQEVTSIAGRTTFNGQGLINGARTNTTAAGTNVDTTGALTTATAVTLSTVDVGSARAGHSYALSSANAGELTLTESYGGTATGRTATVNVADMTAAGTQTLDFGDLGVKLTMTSTADASGTAANIITDLTAGGAETIALATTGAAQLQTGANSTDTTTVGFVNVDIQSSAANATLRAVNTAITGFQTALGTGAPAERAAAKSLMTSLDSALDFVSEQRAGLGAAQNRLEHAISNTKAASENLAASNSRIRDVDVAEESSRMARTQVLLQAGVSVLAQSNQMSQMALKLLG